ncbi:MAG: hypothetical protein HY253_01270 [Burkholderiales bacterium]|nr:hypothetical protein [Burkholderiales bacterium]
MSQRPKAEIVYAVEGYYDGPESGFADFRGHPYRFEVSNELTVRDRTVRRFKLSPVSAELLRLALEQQQLWSRWNSAYREGKLPESLLYPERVLPEDLEAYRALETRIREGLAKSSGNNAYAEGRFFVGRRTTAFRAFGEHLRVVWSRCRPAA